MPKLPTLYVVLDANILIRDFWMSGPAFTYLQTHQFLGHRPVVPEVAYREAKRNLQVRAEELIRKVAAGGQRSKGNEGRLLRLFNLKSRPKGGVWNVQALLRRWDRCLRRFLKVHYGSILPSPKVEVNDILHRSIERIKPFSNGDRGFRDTVIWLTTLELVEPASRVSFVTSNTQDFFAPDSNTPHPDMLVEIEKRLGSDWKVLFHKSLDDFIFEFDADRSASADTLQRALISNSLSGFDLWEWLSENIEAAISVDEFDTLAWAGLPYDAESPILKGVEELISVDVPRLTHLRDDVYRFYCDFSFIGHFSCVVGYNEPETIINRMQILWTGKSDGYWTTVGVRVVATFLGRIDFDVKLRHVIASDFLPLSHWDSYDDCIDSINRMVDENYD